MSIGRTYENEEPVRMTSGQITEELPVQLPLDVPAVTDPRVRYLTKIVRFRYGLRVRVEINTVGCERGLWVDLREIPHPRIGYSGHIKRQLDWQLLRDLTARHPNWFFVFVGSANAHSEILGHVEELSLRKNVRFLGSKTALQLAAYPQHFDVCVMPYRNDDYTKYIYPLKIHEYLSSGRPVIETPIPSLVAFRDSVRLPENAEQWTVAIAQSLEPMANTMESRSARQALPKSHDWNILVLQIAQTMANRLGPAYAALLERNI